MKNKRLIKHRKKAFLFIKRVNIELLISTYYFFCLILTPVSAIVYLFNDDSFKDTWNLMGGLIFVLIILPLIDTLDWEISHQKRKIMKKAIYEK
jgi:hypothetical protein